MKIKLIIFTLIFCTAFNAQQIPYYFLEPQKSLGKISDNSPASNTIERILIDGNNNIWLGTGDGLSMSSDFGSTWKNYYETDEFGKENVYAVKWNNGVVYASLWHLEEFDGTAIPTGSGYRYSADGGTTWVKVDQSVDAKTDTVIQYGTNRLRAVPIATAKQNMIRDFGFTSNAIWIASWGGGLRKSTDNGKTWKRVVLPPDNLDSIKPTDQLNFVINPSINFNMYAFAILVVNDTIYVGTAGGINKSTDGGESWVKFNRLNQQKPITGNFIWSMAYNELDKSIWAATWKAEGQTENWGISVSRDGGRSWQNFFEGERIFDFGFRYYGQPGNYTGADIIAAAETGLYRSSNGGTTWIAATDIVDSEGGRVLLTREFRAAKVQNLQDGSKYIWGGSLNGLVRFSDRNGNWEGDWRVILASAPLKSNDETFAFPNPFAPDEEVVTIKYSLNSPTDITIRIFDFGMNLVRTLIQNLPRDKKEEHSEVWNGRDENGNIVPNGVYFYRIDRRSGEPLFGKILVIM